MKIIEPGHIYHLRYLDDVPGEHGPLVFVNRERGKEHGGTQTQEVLRALIDRTYHCHACLPHYLNSRIIHHLRMALVYHEMRALERKALKGLYAPEDIETSNKDGYFRLSEGRQSSDPNRAPRRDLEE